MCSSGAEQGAPHALSSPEELPGDAQSLSHTQLCPRIHKCPVSSFSLSFVWSRGVGQQLSITHLELWNGSRAQLERPRGKVLQLEALMAAGRFPQNPAASCTSSTTSGVTLLHKRVENSRSKQGCHSEMTARPAAVLPHKNHAHSLRSAGIFGIPSEFVAPGNVSEARAAPSAGSGRCRAPLGPRELPQARSGTATRQLPATEPRRFPLITATTQNPRDAKPPAETSQRTQERR